MKKAMLFTALLMLFTTNSNKANAGDTSFWSTGIGAAIGGYIGSTIGKGRGNLAATAAGTFIGAGIGNSFGRSMERQERRYYTPRYRQSVYYAPRPYRPNYVAPVRYIQPNVIYNSPYERAPREVRIDQGYMGQNMRNYRHRNMRRHGRNCREFTQTIRIDGQIKESYGIACLRPDGSWQMQ